MLPLQDDSVAQVAVLQSLDSNQANHRPSRHKKRYLKIKGDLAEVTNALYKCREKLNEGVEGLCVPTGI